MRISDWSSDVCSSDLLRARFFDAQGQPRDEAFEQLKTDLSTLMLPSRERALALDKAYLAIVREQSFTAGRDAILRPARHVWDAVEQDAPTGITTPLDRKSTRLNSSH